jgi:dTMP kinase
MARGVFITFEGSEGCGKSTQIKRLADALEARGKEVIVTREPGGTPIGEEIRHLLQFSKVGDAMAPESELLLFAASRAQLVREVLQPALHGGTTVIADRFMDSTTVYQGVARRIDTSQVTAINRFAVGDCVPDITFLLDLDPEVARERLRRRPRPPQGEDRMERQPTEFYDAVRAGYLRLAETEPHRVHLLDGSQSEETIAAEIRQQLGTRFHGIF